MTKRVLLALLTAGLVLAPSGAFAAAPSVAIDKLDTAGFPKVTVNLTTPGTTASDIEIEENGQTVENVKIESLQAAGGEVDVVLLIDTSGSMVGEPFASALRAARRFISKLPDGIGLGIVTFDDEARIVQRISADHGDALSALTTFQAAGETALYDGVIAATSLFKGDGQHNIVLLSDGGDTVSKGTLQSASIAARDAKATIRAVGLKSGEFDAGVLRRLAGLTKGRYEAVSTVRLEDLYADFVNEITSQFVITYRSTLPAARDAQVVVRTPHGLDTALYLTPDGHRPEVETEPDPEPGPSLSPWLKLTGTHGLAIVLLLTFATMFIFSTMTLGNRARQKRDRSLAMRMGAVVPEDDRPSKERAPSAMPGWIPDSFVDVAGKVANRGTLGEKVDRKLERASVVMTPPEFFAVTALVAFASAAVGLLLFQSPLMCVVGAGVGAAIPYLVLSIALTRRLKKLHGQLADVLMILASSLRAGHSFLQALDAAAQEAGDPASSEFQRVVAEIRLGRTVPEALNDLADRIDSEDFRWAILAVTIQRDVGGNLAEILDTVAGTMRERETVRRQISVLSAEGKMSMAVLTGLPIVLAGYMAVVNPTYLSLLWTTRIGLVMLITGSVMLMLGLAWMRRVVRIDV